MAGTMAGGAREDADAWSASLAGAASGKDGTLAYCYCCILPGAVKCVQVAIW
jgi:hypothetical protein